jgi:hypothetical protein
MWKLRTHSETLGDKVMFSDNVEKYEIVNRRPIIIKRTSTRFTIAKTNQEITHIIKHENMETRDVESCTFDIQEVLKNLPELLTYDNIAFTKQIVDLLDEKYAINASRWYSFNSNFRTVYLFVNKWIKDGNDVDINQFCDFVDLIGENDLLNKMSHITKSGLSINKIAFNIKGLKPFVAILCCNLHVFYDIVNDPLMYSKIDSKIGNLIASYYVEGYIHDPKKLLEILSSVRFTESKRNMFVKFLKEKYADLGCSFSEVSKLLDWMNTGTFDNAKDYYMKRNYERFTEAFNPKKYDQAIADVYNNPANAIINISKLK